MISLWKAAAARSAFFDTAILFDDLLGLLDGSGLTFDVSENGVDLGSFTHDFDFESANETVRRNEREVLVKFDVKFNMQFALMRLYAEIVNCDVVSGCNGAHAVEDAVRAWLARDGADDDVRLSVARDEPLRLPL